MQEIPSKVYVSISRSSRKEVLDEDISQSHRRASSSCESTTRKPPRTHFYGSRFYFYLGGFIGEASDQLSWLQEKTEDWVASYKNWPSWRKDI
jgi:hypothetical protein